ncbi:MAG TPA: sigma-70 family RNA polymerase sigma factor [Polyangiaceae bacterium]
MTHFPTLTADEEQRLAAMLTMHFASVWRAGRRAGLSEAQAEETAQEAYAIAARRLADIECGCERAYLIAVAMRLALNLRRRSASRRELTSMEPERYAALGSAPNAEDLLARKRQRELLDRILESMSETFREVLTLYEIHDLTLPEIARALDIPEGTATSRLRRARDEFSRKLKRALESNGRMKELP